MVYQNFALQAFVFVVGGGNYIEYQNLQDYRKRQQNLKTITYGTSQLMNARDFLLQVFGYCNTMLSFMVNFSSFYSYLNLVETPSKKNKLTLNVFKIFFYTIRHTLRSSKTAPFP